MSEIQSFKPDWSTRRRMALVLMGFALVYSLFIARTMFVDDGRIVGTLFDDSLISMRFARNLATGHGLVWNPGEVPPVEGYTNLGWTLVMSAVMLVFPTVLAPIAVSAIGAGILLACGVVASRILELVGGRTAIQLGGMAVVLGYFPLVFWTLRGMEVGLLALLALSAIAVA